MSSSDLGKLDMRHLEDGLLLRYLDGELPGRKVRQVRNHLEACWQCRAQMEELQGLIGDCVRYRKSVLASGLPSPPAEWRSLDFEQADAELAAESVIVRLARLFSPRQHPGIRWALSGAAALAIGFVLVQQLRETPRVEAAALLQKAVLVSNSHPAAHKRLRITTRTGQITRLVGLAYKPAARETEIARLFDSAHYDWNDPLSARSYSVWRGQLPHFQEAVSAQPNIYDIKTTTEDNELVSATLKLRVSDLEPLEGHFEFRNREWVDLTELVDQQTTNPASTVAGTTGGMPRQPGVSPDPLAVPESTARPSSSSEELRVFAALHQLGADLGDPLEISHQGGKVLVSGTGVPPARQQELHSVLDRLPHVVLRFDDPNFPASATPAPSEPATRDAAGTEKPTYPARIEERLGGRPQFERFSSSVLDWTDSSMTRAYALRRLAQQFTAKAEGEMSPEDRRTLRRLASEHLAAFTKDENRVANTVKPIVAGIGPNLSFIEVTESPTTWQEASEQLLASSRKAETLLAVVLGVTAPDNTTANAPGQLLTALAQVSRNAEHCQRLLAEK